MQSIQFIKLAILFLSQDSREKLSNAIETRTYPAELARLQNKAAKRNRLLDFQLVILLLKGHVNKQIAKNLVNPVSTTQRRTRLIFREDLLFQRYNRIMQGPEDIRIMWKKEKISIGKLDHYKRY